MRGADPPFFVPRSIRTGNGRIRRTHFLSGSPKSTRGATREKWLSPIAVFWTVHTNAIRNVRAATTLPTICRSTSRLGDAENLPFLVFIPFVSRSTRRSGRAKRHTSFSGTGNAEVLTLNETRAAAVAVQWVIVGSRIFRRTRDCPAVFEFAHSVTSQVWT